MKLPTFLIIGVQKAGTTSIYNYLAQHPQVYMSPIKETNFFMRDPSLNTSSDVSNQTTKSGRKKIVSFEDYYELFTGVTDEIAIGEASPNYLVQYQITAKQIKHYLPNAKLICILRNPIERAYSDYLMHVRDVVGNTRSLSEQIKYSGDKSSILRKGFYYEQLQHFYDNFNSEQIKVYLYDNLCQDPVNFMQDMYKFIGVDDGFSPDTSQKSQVAKIPKNQTVHKMLNSENSVRTLSRNILKLLLPLELRQQIRNKLININSQDKKQALLAREERQQLIEFYRDDITKLENLIKRDLSAWLKI